MGTDQNVTALVPNQKKAYADIRDYLLARKGALDGVAPKYLDTERMIRLALGASSRQPKLLQCTPVSWLLALMDCAYYGLEPNAVLGHAYLVPLQNRKIKGQPLEVNFWAGYKGLILLACETAGFDDVDARPVYARELEEGRFEETPEDALRPFRHRPLYTERGELVGAYAIGWRGPDKRPRFRYVTKDEIDATRKRSRASSDGPWVTDYNAMAMKTAVRRMLALAQMKPGAKVGVLLEQESADERGELVRSPAAEAAERHEERAHKSMTDQLADDLQRKAHEEEAPPPEVPADEEER